MATPPESPLVVTVRAAASAEAVSRAFLSPEGLSAGRMELRTAIRAAQFLDPGLLWGFLRDGDLLAALEQSPGMVPTIRRRIRQEAVAMLLHAKAGSARDQALDILQSITPAAELAEGVEEFDALWASCLPTHPGAHLSIRHARNIAAALTFAQHLTSDHLLAAVVQDLPGIPTALCEALLRHPRCDERVMGALVDTLGTLKPGQPGADPARLPYERWEHWVIACWDNPAFRRTEEVRHRWWRLLRHEDFTLDHWVAILSSGVLPDAQIAAHALLPISSSGEKAIMRTMYATPDRLRGVLDREVIAHLLRSEDAQVRAAGLLGTVHVTDDDSSWPPPPPLEDPDIWRAVLEALGSYQRSSIAWADSVPFSGSPQDRVRISSRRVADLERLSDAMAGPPLSAAVLEALLTTAQDDVQKEVRRIVHHCVEVHCLRTAVSQLSTELPTTIRPPRPDAGTPPRSTLRPPRR